MGVAREYYREKQLTIKNIRALNIKIKYKNRRIRFPFQSTRALPASDFERRAVPATVAQPGFAETSGQMNAPSLNIHIMIFG